MENNVVEDKKRNMLVGALICIIILLLALIIYLVFIKKNTTEEPNKVDEPIQQVEDKNLVSSKIAETGDLSVILDTKGNVYLALKDEGFKNFEGQEYKTLFDKAYTYNLDGDETKLVKVNVSDAKDIQCLMYGNGGASYIIITDNSNRVYTIIDYKVASGKVELYTDTKLTNVSKVYQECDDDACVVYADATVDGKEEKVDFYDVFDKYEIRN